MRSGRTALHHVVLSSRRKLMLSLYGQRAAATAVCLYSFAAHTATARIAADQRPVEKGMRTSAAHLRSAEQVP
jgi:hypothetical protein